MIMRAMEESLPWEQLQTFLDKLMDAIQSFDCQRSRDILLASVDGYEPNNGIDDLIWKVSVDAQSRQQAATAASVITQLDSRRPAG